MHPASRSGLFGSVVAGLSAVSLLIASSFVAVAETAVPTIEIATVNGQPAASGQLAESLSGDVTVNGTSSTDGHAPAESQPLVADAGDSAFVAAGEKAILLGSAYGGVGPYTFVWSSTSGALSDPGSSSTEWDATGVAEGTYDVTLTVTDANGAEVADIVKVVVYETRQQTLLDADFVAQNPSLIVVGWQVDRKFTVPRNVITLVAGLTFDGEANRYRLQLLDPDGDAAVTRETQRGEQVEVSVRNPRPGEWTARVVQWEPIEPQTAHVTVTAESIPDDPRPTVSAGGPYTFPTGAPQALTGKVSGGSLPVSAAWDLDGDGVFEADGNQLTAHLPEGRHLVTLKATDAAGLERRETTSVLIADPAVIDTQTTPLTVIGVADTGINPYHLEFSAQTYPDPDVLRLTGNFTKHPSEYIPGYPKDAQALNVTLGKGYFPSEDTALWDGSTTIQAGEWHWLPGTKIIGAIDADASGDGPHPILDDDGHGSGSASVAVGNRYGYCPTCLLVVVEGLDETVIAGLPWVDISSNSFGYLGGLPFGLIGGNPEATKKSAERGQTTLFAAGNGVAGAFDVPVSTWHSDLTGPDWNITVGAVRHDNQRAIIGDGVPVHLSSWGDGNLPSACGTGTVGQCAFGGTSASTPYAAGVFGTVLTQVRAAVGDGRSGQRPGQAVAVGIPRTESDYLRDGKLTRGELREAVLKTAEPLGRQNTGLPFLYPATAPYAGDANVVVEGYGVATPNSAQRAVDVLLDRAPLPDRPLEDTFFALDRSVRDSVWGGFDRTGDGQNDSDALSPALAEQLGLTSARLIDIDTPEDALTVLRAVALANAPAAESTERPLGADTIDYYLHRRVADAPDAGGGCSSATVPTTAVGGNEQYMDRQNAGGDLEPCFDSRVTTVAAAFRPVGLFASTDMLDAPLPAGSTVTVELYLASETPALIQPTGVLMATDRAIGPGDATPLPVLGSGPDGAACSTLGETCWTKFAFTFDTTRPAFTGEQLAFQLQLIGTRSWAIGHEGAHASRISIQPADLPESGLEFGVTIESPADGSSVAESETVMAGGAYAFPDLGEDPAGAGDHPVTERVEVAIDDPDFATPHRAVLDQHSRTWHVDLGRLQPSERVLYARARRDTTTSEVVSSRFTVTADHQVQWQVVQAGSSALPDAWRSAQGLRNWTFTFTTGDYGTGPHTILARLTERGREIVRDEVGVEFR